MCPENMDVFVKELWGELWVAVKLAERWEGCWRFAWEKLGEKGKGWVG